MEYNFNEIEKKWQRQWVEDKTYKVAEDKDRRNSMCSTCFLTPRGQDYTWDTRSDT